MPSMKLENHLAQIIVLFPNQIGDEEVSVALSAVAPDDVVQRLKDWYAANPGTDAKDAAMWLQGKGWGVVVEYETVCLGRTRKKS